MRLPFLVGILALCVCAGCSTTRQTDPQRTATEQLLISTAADHAVEDIKLDFAPGAKVFVDATNFEGTDSKYAIAAIRDRILKLGGRLVADRGQSDVVVEIRAGALSIDQSQTLVGIPGFDIPVPLAGPLGFPEIALYKKAQRRGVAKFAATSYGAKEGEGQDSSGPRYGFSHETHWVVFFFFSWTTDDLLTDEARERSRNVDKPKTDPPQ
jgi:hypothetical protein